VELDRRTWNAVLKLALAISVLATLVATTVSAAGDVPQVAIVVPVIVVAFVASWIQTGRVQRREMPLRIRNTHG
jgi:Flp pilus assembly protein TadB